jgi:hypothetical protein
MVAAAVRRGAGWRGAWSLPAFGDGLAIADPAVAPVLVTVPGLYVRSTAVTSM